jgi:hypothetical protein
MSKFGSFSAHNNHTGLKVVQTCNAAQHDQCCGESPKSTIEKKAGE